MQVGLAAGNVQEIDILYGDYLGEMEDISIEATANMEKASDFGSEDSRFESSRGRFVDLKRDLSFSKTVRIRDSCR